MAAPLRVLIADDVGLGKTIEAGLVIQEMLLRHRARTVLIICPASLQEKWRIEMLEKFGLEFTVVDTAYIKQLRRERGIHANPWTSHPRLIASMDWAKGGEGLRAMRDVLPPHVSYPRKFDILVVDEAHNVAPAAGTHYALESQRTRFVRAIGPHFQHRLFLTATPHNGYTESFTSLLELLDDQRFARNILPDEKRLSQVMIRRLKSDLVDADGNPSALEIHTSSGFPRLDQAALDRHVGREQLQIEGDRIRERMATLSPRERDVLELMARGLSNAASCRELHISVKTVEPVVSSIFTKLDLPAGATVNRRVLAVVAYMAE